LSRKNKKEATRLCIGTYLWAIGFHEDRKPTNSESQRKTFKVIPNLQTIKPKSITIKPKSSISASPISISLTRRGNRGGDVHKTGYRRARRERKRKREELTLSTTEASGLQRETPRETVGERAGEVGRLKRLPRDGESER
jgi:hypothetical protein